MRFLDDDMERHNKKLLQGEVKKLSIQDIVQRIVESHANGIRFREWRAGREIDRQMDSEGFNISLKLDENTGFIVGGSYRNCKMYLFMLGLTWMDKMGSSEKARNLGFPATSRDGAPIEMTALLKLALDFLHREFSHKHYKYDGVRVGVHTLTFKSWSD
jgi:glycogen debranching enzyme